MARLRNEESGGIGAGLLDTLRDILEDREVEMCSASLLGVRATNNFGA